jgi:hypothetical protein
MIQRNRARAREYFRVRYAQNPTLYNQRTVASRRLRRLRVRIASRTHLRRCFVGNHLFEVTDGRFATCGDPAHQKAWQRELWRRASARYYNRHFRVLRRSRYRVKRYAPRAQYILTELMA